MSGVAIATAALHVAPLFAGVFALIQVPMTIAVGYRRLRTGIQFLDEGDAVLLRRMRAHGNFTETVPITLIVMAAAEWRGAPVWLLLAGGCSLLCGRAMHYVTLLRSGFGIGRAIGMVLTFLPMTAFALCSLWRGGW
jgi:hypothetical protein